MCVDTFSKRIQLFHKHQVDPTDLEQRGRNVFSLKFTLMTFSTLHFKKMQDIYMLAKF